jgi:hypothetical protein
MLRRAVQGWSTLQRKASQTGLQRASRWVDSLGKTAHNNAARLGSLGSLGVPTAAAVAAGVAAVTRHPAAAAAWLP